VEIALHDMGIDADRQVRAVLLDRGDGQDGDRLVHGQTAEIVARQVDPVAGGEHGGMILGFAEMSARRQPLAAAMISTSTLNSSRVKPETIISVEAGGGSRTNRSRTSI